MAYQGVEKLNIFKNPWVTAQIKPLPRAGQDVQKGPLACAEPKPGFDEARSSKATGSEKAEAY